MFHVQPVQRQTISNSIFNSNVLSSEYFKLCADAKLSTVAREEELLNSASIYLLLSIEDDKRLVLIDLTRKIMFRRLELTSSAREELLLSS